MCGCERVFGIIILLNFAWPCTQIDVWMWYLHWLERIISSYVHFIPSLFLHHFFLIFLAWWWLVVTFWFILLAAAAVATTVVVHLVFALFIRCHLFSFLCCTPLLLWLLLLFCFVLLETYFSAPFFYAFILSFNCIYQSERREILFLIFTFPWALHSPLN